VSSKEPSSSFWSFITFSWFDDTIAVGYEKPLFQTDLDALIPEDCSKFTSDTFKKQYLPNNSMLVNLLKYNGIVILRQAVSALICSLLSAASPYFMQRILIFAEGDGDGETSQDALFYAISIFIIGFVPFKYRNHKTSC
jgi:DNA segregation ATPase FtsK/SpoIIIE-like protein